MKRAISAVSRHVVAEASKVRYYLEQRSLLFFYRYMSTEFTTVCAVGAAVSDSSVVTTSK